MANAHDRRSRPDPVMWLAESWTLSGGTPSLGGSTAMMTYFLLRRSETIT